MSNWLGVLLRRKDVTSGCVLNCCERRCDAEFLGSDMLSGTSGVVSDMLFGTSGVIGVGAGMPSGLP